MFNNVTYGLRVACKNQRLKKTYLCQHFKGNDIHVPNNEANNIKVTNKSPCIRKNIYHVCRKLNKQSCLFHACPTLKL